MTLLLACGYRNTSDRMVILRCTGPEQFFLERVVFPFELLSFQCPAKSDIKVWTHGLGGPELVESFQAKELLIDPPPATTKLQALQVPAVDQLPWVIAG
ncbi:MAG: DUF1830 domain-containing protein [Cyanobium sp.]